jgi:hypothetical protein
VSVGFRRGFGICAHWVFLVHGRERKREYGSPAAPARSVGPEPCGRCRATWLHPSPEEHTHARARARAHTHTHKPTHTHACTHTQRHTLTQTHSHTHIHTHTHTHERARRPSRTCNYTNITLPPGSSQPGRQQRAPAAGHLRRVAARQLHAHRLEAVAAGLAAGLAAGVLQRAAQAEARFDAAHQLVAQVRGVADEGAHVPARHRDAAGQQAAALGAEAREVAGGRGGGVLVAVALALELGGARRG